MEALRFSETLVNFYQRDATFQNTPLFVECLYSIFRCFCILFSSNLSFPCAYVSFILCCFVLSPFFIMAMPRLMQLDAGLSSHGSVFGTKPVYMAVTVALGQLCVLVLRFCTGPRGPRSLRLRSAAACLLRLWVRIPPEGMDVCLLWVLCVVQVEVSATDWSLIQRSPTDCGASECDLETSWMRRPWPTGGNSTKIKLRFCCTVSSHQSSTTIHLIASAILEILSVI
jgi:hypothetical protein